MCAIIITERGKEIPKRKEIHTMTYTITFEELNAMTLADVVEYINVIENDAEMISAEMADKLFGEEKKMYETNQATLRTLYQKKGILTPTSVETLKSNIQFYNKKIEELEKQNKMKNIWKDNPEMWERVQFSIKYNNIQIQEYKDKIAEYERELATR